jgi:CCR4-NOT transcription complex subunit 3
MERRRNNHLFGVVGWLVVFGYRLTSREMDRVFKRVAEGVIAFDAIYDKVQQTTNHSQKEKLEQVCRINVRCVEELP